MNSVLCGIDKGGGGGVRFAGWALGFPHFRARVRAGAVPHCLALSRHPPNVFGAQIRCRFVMLGARAARAHGSRRARAGQGTHGSLHAPRRSQPPNLYPRAGTTISYSFLAWGGGKVEVRIFWQFSAFLPQVSRNFSAAVFFCLFTLRCGRPVCSRLQGL